MSTSSDSIFSKPEIIDFYTSHLKDFGDTAQGVGWKNNLAQQVRFSHLIKVVRPNHAFFSINDFGCGTGEFYNYLLTQGFANIEYRGYDLLEEMIFAAKKKLAIHNEATLNKIDLPSDMLISDYSVASGVFNIKYNARDMEWRKYILDSLTGINEKSKLGFSFNLLSLYSDEEFRKPYLYYADPLFFFDFCKRSFSKNVALLHDYDQYDFTIIVRKN